MREQPRLLKRLLAYKRMKLKSRSGLARMNARVSFKKIFYKNQNTKLPRKHRQYIERLCSAFKLIAQKLERANFLFHGNRVNHIKNVFFKLLTSIKKNILPFDNPISVRGKLVHLIA